LKTWGTSTHVNGDRTQDWMHDRTASAKRTNVSLCSIDDAEAGVVGGGGGTVFRRLGLTTGIGNDLSDRGATTYGASGALVRGWGLSVEINFLRPKPLLSTSVAV